MKSLRLDTADLDIDFNGVLKLATAIAQQQLNDDTMLLSGHDHERDLEVAGWLERMSCSLRDQGVVRLRAEPRHATGSVIKCGTVLLMFSLSPLKPDPSYNTYR